MVVKQALERLRVTDDWTAKQERTELEAAAMRLFLAEDASGGSSMP